MTQHIIDSLEQSEDSNHSNNRPFSDVLQKTLDRRSVLKGGTGLTAAAFFGALPLAGCKDNNNSSTTDPQSANAAVTASGDLSRPSQLNFTAVAHSTAADMTVADGYKAEMMLPLGAPIMHGIDEWKDNREQSGESFKYRMGDNHDGMWFFGKTNDKYDPKASDSGILVMNHEYVNPNELNPMGYHVSDNDSKDPLYQKKRLVGDIRREVNCHGVAVVELQRRENGQGYEMVQRSKFNKRYTSATDTLLSGPVAGSEFAITKFDPTGYKTRGINNNCGAGLSPWGTYLTTEENFRNVFARGKDTHVIGEQQNIARERYGVPENFATAYLWHTGDSSSASFPDEFARWDMTAKGNDATEDYRNVMNTFGYITEIDPFNPHALAVKRTALGRFAHENCAYAPVEEGKPVVCYMGDDSRGEYIYKFVSDAKWSNADIGGGIKAGDKYLDKGTLYVAVFKEDGTGEWKELTFGKNGLDNSRTDFAFTSQADVLVHTRIAADILGATPMDRPEWVSVSPITGEIYVTLTNNKYRGNRDDMPADAANPRSYDVRDKKRGNDNGHIIRWAQTNGDHTSNTFEWDIYLFAAPHDLAAENLSGLNANNDLSSPDGLFFDPRGVLWIQTDDGAYTDTTSCMLLAALPGQVNDGKEVTSSAGVKTRVGMQANDNNIKRFFVGPAGCEVTGITLTPDFKTLFINIQHPGGSWGAVAGGKTPRSATVMITREDGDVILAESFAQQA